MLALYVVVEEPEAAIRVKFAGEVSLDAQTGRLTVSLGEIPKLEIESATVDIPGGPNALLSTPLTCGSHSTEADLETWPGDEAHPLGHFDLTEGPAGSAFAATEAETPDHPAFSVATTNPQGGAYSPLTTHLSRENGSQRIDALNFTLPPGLLGKLAGVAVCSDAQIAQAQALSDEGRGRPGAGEPLLPALASQLGTITVGAGHRRSPLRPTVMSTSPAPTMAHPCRWSRSRRRSSVPLISGVVVDHVATYVNPITAQINGVTETIPTIVHGLPLDIRSITVALDRDQFILNPTNCNPLATTGFTTSTLGQVSPISSPFQASGCAALPFKPQLSLSLQGKTRRAASPALVAILTAQPGEANSAAGQVTLPRLGVRRQRPFPEDLHQSPVCRGRRQRRNVSAELDIWRAPRCSRRCSKLPEEGPVFLRSDPENKSGLPDLVAALRGPPAQPIAIDLVGKVDSAGTRFGPPSKSSPMARSAVSNCA